MLRRGLITILLLSGAVYSMGTPPPNYDNNYDNELAEAVSADIKSIQEDLQTRKEAQLSSLKLENFVFQEKLVVKKDGRKVKKNIPVKQVLRDTDVIYINILTNNDRGAKTNIVVKNPIPEGTEYVKGSATCGEGCNISYSRDGGQTLKQSDRTGASYIEFHFKNIYPRREVRMGFRAIIK